VLFLTLLCTLNVFPVSISFGSEQENTQTITKVELEEFDLEEMIKAEDIEDLKLTIYALSGNLLYRIPPKAEQVKIGCDAKVEVTGEELAKNIELFYKIKSSSLTPRNTESAMYCQLVYVLESEKNGVLFEADFWYFNEERTVQVNGVEVDEEQFLYDILLAYSNEVILGWWEPLLHVNYQSEQID